MDTQLNSRWFSNMRMDILSGVTVALALIPEAIAFSIIAGVDPMVGLHASFCIAVVIAFAGGRPGMISAATGAMALLMVTLVRDHGLEFLFAATILTGILQIIFGLLKIGKLISFVPQSVMNGFVNALAILIFTAQLTHFTGQSWVMYALVGLTLLIIYLLPRLTKAIPSALAAIVIVSCIVIGFGLNVNTVGDMGELTRSFPIFHIPQVLLNWETLLIIFPYSLSLALVGIMESLLTATVVDEMTDTPSDKNREVRGQGLANVVTGFFGGMAGCAMIGQSVINVKSGGRTRLSALVAGVFLLFLILVLGDIVKMIPMAALVGVMIMVSIGTFNWGSLTAIKKIPMADTFVMLTTVAIVLITHDLSIGVITGVVLSAVIYAVRSAKLGVSRIVEGKRTIYKVRGQFFFATTTKFNQSFAFLSDGDTVIVDFGDAQVWDHSAVTSIAKMLQKYEALGKNVQLIGLNEDSRNLIEKIGLTASAGH